MTDLAPTHEEMLAMNEALIRGSVRQHELTEAVSALNVLLQEEIAERKRFEAALRENEKRYRDLFNAIDEGFCVIEKVESDVGAPLDFRYLEANPAFAMQSGMSGMIGKTIRQMLPDEPEGWCSIYDTVLRTGEPVRFERDFVTYGRTLELYALRVEDETHRRVAVIFKDVTERKQAMDRQQVLLDELAHRSRNLLAVFQAIVVRSLSGMQSLDEAREGLMRRIQALAHSQSALEAQGHTGATVAEIVRLELEGFSDRIAASGPDVLLDPRRAQTFSLLVHELATNASKYGALSTTGGEVAIRWSAGKPDTADRFRFQWQERNGPRVVPPTRKGFGRSLLENVVAQDFRTTPKIGFAPEGLTYEIDAPLSRLASDGAHAR